MIIRQEFVTSLHEPEKFVLAVVDQTAIQFNLKRLFERAGPSTTIPC